MDTITLDPAADGGRFEHNFNKVVGSGHLGLTHLEVTLEENACLLVDLVPTEDHTSTYYGLDEAFYDNLSV